MLILHEKTTPNQAAKKHALADLNCPCKMTSVLVLDGVMWFIHLTDVTNTC